MYINLMLTMLLGGLWHGAAWTFVMWGFLHGLYLCIERPVRARWGQRSWVKRGPVQLVLALLTFTVVTITWVFFRSPDFPTAGRLLASMAGVIPMKAMVLSTLDLLKVGIIMAALLAAHWGLRHTTVERAAAAMPWWAFCIIWTAMIAAIFVTQGSGNAFIYFQF
jgi:alginate O-acetyltransferase complex protein AlgI